jgi:peptidoglycan/LPS O-acetylase OafA/YrhL
VVIVRRAGAVVMLGLVTAVVAVIGVLAPSMPAVHLLLRLTPEFATLFALGLVAAGVLGAGERVRRLPWHWLAALAALPVLIVLIVQDSVWWDARHYWVDLAIGPAVALLLAALATRRPAPLVWLLDTRPVRSLGSFSYSLYLIHAPIVVVINRKLVAPYVAPGLPTLWVTLALAVPVSVLAARLFAAVFEIPFQRYRSWAPLRAAARARLTRLRRRAPHVEPSVSEP